MGPFSWAFSSWFERSKRWYAIAATVIISGTVVSFLVGEYLLGIVLIIFAGVYLLYDINTHPVVNVIVNDEGISLSGVLYAYDRMQSFRIIRVDNTPMILRFTLKSKTVDRLDIFLDPTVNIEEVTTLIATHITQEAIEDMSAMGRLLLWLRL